MVLSRDCDGEWYPFKINQKSRIIGLHFFINNGTGALCNRFKTPTIIKGNKITKKCPRCLRILERLKQVRGNWKFLYNRQYHLQQPSKARPKSEHKIGLNKHTEESKLKISISHLRDKNPNWAGDTPKHTDDTGHLRAERWLPKIEGKEKHHIDGNPMNNELSNILYVTRKEHMKIDGRLIKLQTTQFRKGVNKIAE